MSCGSTLASSPCFPPAALARIVRGDFRSIRVSAASWMLPSGAARGGGCPAGLGSAENSFALPSGREGTLRALRFSAGNPSPPTLPLPHPLPSSSSTLGMSSPCLLVWGCLDLTKTSQGIQQCAKSQVWKSRRMQDAVPASLRACEKETGESASVCQTRCFY